MPWFYFDTHDGENVLRDEQGLDLPGLRNAREEASQTLAEMIVNAMPDGDYREMKVEVRDDAKRLLFTVRITFQVEAPQSELPKGVRRLLRR